MGEMGSCELGISSAIHLRSSSLCRVLGEQHDRYASGHALPRPDLYRTGPMYLPCERSGTGQGDCPKVAWRKTGKANQTRGSPESQGDSTALEPSEH